MRRVSRRIALLALSLAIADTRAFGQSQSAITNATVIQMVSAKLSDDVIVTAIDEAPNRNFDLSPAGLIALKNAGVADVIIEAMQDVGHKPADPKSDYAAASAPPPADLAAPATIYVYWPKQARNGGRFSVSCDGQAVADLNNGHFVALRAPAGTHTIKARKSTLSAVVSAGDSYYVRVSYEGLNGDAARLMNPEEGAAELHDKGSESNELSKTYSSACK